MIWDKMDWAGLDVAACGRSEMGTDVIGQCGIWSEARLDCTPLDLAAL